MIVGISGKKFAGKDTLANYIKKYDSDYIILHFADKLKLQLVDIFNIDPEYLLNPSLKEKMLDRPIVMDDFLSQMCSVTGLNICQQNKIALTPRQLLQWYGTDYVRSADNNYWINITKKDIENSKSDKIIISDLRLPNEEAMLRELGAKIIKAVRISMKSHNDNHISENPDLIKSDLTLSFVENDFSLHMKAAELIVLGKFEEALELDSSEFFKHSDNY